ncbi:hypothetical protein CHS0354_002043 [Potamilus streckersoni]|uniref:Uncharacterized protein n=1 Tax=Potamilus streckersoni TaxID=2493646 RepID=A0AAE0T5I5_9BIVA|nr:hypothetical protein CHS0354_002043 [Potamilus streckersoni]
MTSKRFYHLHRFRPGLSKAQQTNKQNNSANAQNFTIESFLNTETPKSRSLFVIIPFEYRGLTENSALIFGNRFSENLKNIPRFDTVSPEKIIGYLNEAKPDLLSCNHIDCGMQIAKLFEARFYTVTRLELRDNFFSMNLDVVDVYNGSIVYKEQLNFPKDDIYKALDDLSRRINQNIIYEARVLGAGKRRIVLNIGSDDGLKLTDRVIIYNRDILNFYKPKNTNRSVQVTLEKDGKEELIEEIKEEPPKPEEELPQFSEITAARSVIEITRLERNMSEGLVKMTINTAEPALQESTAAFYIDRLKQADLIEKARREIDQYHGWRETEIKEPPKVTKEEEPPPLIVPIPLPITERNEWIRKVRHWEGERDFFQYMLIGSIAAGLVSFYVYKSFNAVQLVPIGLAAYSTYALLFSRAELNKLIEEGKYKGYIRTIGDSYNDPTLMKDKDQGRPYPVYQLSYNIHF